MGKILKINIFQSSEANKNKLNRICYILETNPLNLRITNQKMGYFLNKGEATLYVWL